MRYLIIKSDYSVSQSKILSGYLRAQCKRGNISIIDTRRMRGMNLDGTWSDVNEFKRVEDEPLIEVKHESRNKFEGQL